MELSADNLEAATEHASESAATVTSDYDLVPSPTEHATARNSRFEVKLAVMFLRDGVFRRAEFGYRAACEVDPQARRPSKTYNSVKGSER